MTIPSRPAPAPPGSRGQTAAAGANATLEQLRLQLQQQHLQQQQAGNGALQKISIKLPPPPKGPMQQHHNKKNISNNNNINFFEENQTTITRKFPPARYTPATSWDDSPFSATAASGNGNFKKMPPPRPPPPKMQVNGQRKPVTSAQQNSGGGGASGLISNIFHRKKATTNTSASAAAAASKAATQNRIYGLSSGQTSSYASSSSMVTSNSFSNTDLNAAWNAAATVTTTTSTHHISTHTSSSSAAFGVAEPQLINFDSPPSSPTFTQKSNSDCVSVDSFSSDSNFGSPNNGSVSQPESGFEDDYNARSRPATTSPLDPWESLDNCNVESAYGIGTVPVRQLQQQTRPMAGDNPLCNGRSLLPPTQSLTMPTIIKPKISQKPKAPRPPPFLNQQMGWSEPTPPSPPMPKGAPPPLPEIGAGAATATTKAVPTAVSILDVISGKVDALELSNGSTGYLQETETPYAIALYDFEGVEEGDLTFRENEKIYLVEQPTAEWFRGRTRAGCEGIFPVNYVNVIVPLESGSTSSTQLPQQQQQQSSMPIARCLYNFPGEVQGDLALQENDLVTVMYRINEDWLYGEIAGRQGQFPANFLENVPKNLPTA